MIRWLKEGRADDCLAIADPAEMEGCEWLTQGRLDPLCQRDDKANGHKGRQLPYTLAALRREICIL